MKIRHRSDDNVQREEQKKSDNHDDNNNSNSKKKTVHNSKRLDCDYIFNNWKQVYFIINGGDSSIRRPIALQNRDED